MNDKLNILVVEDSSCEIEHAQRSLEGHNITIVSDLESALTKLEERHVYPENYGYNMGTRKNRFDAVLIDTEFPFAPGKALGLFGPIVVLHALSVGANKIALMVPPCNDRMEWPRTANPSVHSFYVREPGWSRLCSGMAIKGRYSDVTFLISDAIQVFQKDTMELMGEVKVDVQANCKHSGLEFSGKWENKDKNEAVHLKHWSLTLKQLIGEKRIHTEMQYFSCRDER